MKLKEFLAESIEVDVEGSLTDDWIIAFIGPVKLTEAAKAQFAAILDNEVHFFHADGVVVDVEDEEQDELAMQLFYAAAGYCSRSDYQNYFLM